MRGERPLRILELAAVEGTVKSLLLRLCERLRDDGYAVQVACAPHPYGRRLPEWLPIHGVPFSRKFLSPWHLVALVRLFRLLRRERYDIVHVHTPIASIIGRIAAWMARVPYVVYTAHGFPFHERMSRLTYRLAVWVERFFCRRMADLVFVQSLEDIETARRERICARGGLPPVWVGNGVDLTLFCAGEEPLVREEFDFSPDVAVVTFVGRMSPEKGLPELIEALAMVRSRFPAVRTLLVGGHTVEHRGKGLHERLLARIGELGLQDVVRFTGTRTDVERLLRGSDLLVLPSHREGLPRSIIEAMATALPVVATNIRGCREEVVDGETGFLVPVHDVRCLADAIARLLENPSLARAMGAAGRRRAEELFDEERAIDRQLTQLRRLPAVAPRRER